MILTTWTWQRLGQLFHESRKYRGDTSVTFATLGKLLESIREKGSLEDPNVDLDPKGGAFSCEYSFDPTIWGKWFPSQDTALAIAATDKDVTDQHAGRSQGHMAHKTNWGGRVVATPGKPRGDFERLPSAMDRYDVLMQGEVGARAKVDRRTGQTTTVNEGQLTRVAYSPSIGSSEERKARLVALISGQASPALSRRPQPHRPEPTPKQAARWDQVHRPAQPVPRVGQNLRPQRQDDDEVDRALSPERKK